MSGQLYVISGPSGVGKSSIIKRLRERLTDIAYSISHTSRKPRANEVNGVHYHFVDTTTFRQMIEEGAFVEWAEVYGDLYGTSFSSLNSQMDSGLDVLMDLDSQGAKSIRDHYRDSILIYVLPPSLEALEKRLMGRATDAQAVVNARVKRAFKELQDCTWYPYIIINDDLNKAVKEAQAIIISERCRGSRRLPQVKELLGF
jgi:guanylate kinase